MTLSASQIEVRRKFVGSSDAAALCGEDPYKTPLDVYLTKVYETTDITSDAIVVGDLLEPMLIDYAEKVLGISFERSVWFDNGKLSANLDAIQWSCEGEGESHVEAKTTSLQDGWGEESVPNDVPAKVLIQCHHQFHCAGTNIAYVPVLLGGIGGLKLKLYRVERNDRLVESVVERCESFWDKYVTPMIPPPGDPGKLDTLKRIIREPNKSVVVQSKTVQAFETAKAMVKLAKDCQRVTEAQLLTEMGDAEEGVSDDGTYTYMEYDRKGHAVKPSTYRKLVRAKDER